MQEKKSRSELNDKYLINKRQQLIQIGNRNGLHDGCIRTGRNETFTHRLAKFLYADACKKSADVIYTECIFEGGARADIYDVTVNKAIEIIETETREECIAKMGKYPESLGDPIIKTAKEIIDKYLGEGVYERLKGVDKPTHVSQQELTTEGKITHEGYGKIIRDCEETRRELSENAGYCAVCPHKKVYGSCENCEVISLEPEMCPKKKRKEEYCVECRTTMDFEYGTYRCKQCGKTISHKPQDKSSGIKG